MSALPPTKRKRALEGRGRLSAIAPAPVSPFAVRLFMRVAERYVRGGFHAVRLLRSSADFARQSTPKLVFANHPSWWDPLVGLVLARQLWPERAHYALIDVGALERYRFFARLGFVGVPKGSVGEGRQFLRRCQGIFEQPNATLWVTPQARFADPRERPVELASGIAHLMRLLDGESVLPLAIEYPFWEERYPEALLAFGEPLSVGGLSLPATGELHRQACHGLEAAQDALAAAAIACRGEAFETLLHGSAGVGGVYDRWRRLRARWRGESFRAEHGEIAP